MTSTHHTFANANLLEPVLDKLDSVKGPDRQGWHTTRCPFHDDQHPSLRISAKGFKCLACGEKGNLHRLAAKLGLAIPPTNKVRKGQGEQWVTLSQLAQAKGLPLEFLKDLAWRDVEYQGRPAVAIPYLDSSGNQLRQQLRVRLTKDLKRDNRFVWAPGHGVWPLGLERLQHAREAGYLLIVEGATDYAACLLAGIPVLGVPGANTWRREWAAYLEGIPRLYVWQEPDR
jgi:putative DNA primase/helicase